MMSETTSMISATEAAVYDRQMRLWGVEAQKRLQKSHVFISGLNAMGAELVKNLVLSGMNVTIHDVDTVTATCISRQFFFSIHDIGKNVINSCTHVLIMIVEYSSIES
jgi:ubiquitin-like 1-activating enzyme E1 A